MKKTRKKLSLNKHTIRNLTGTVLRMPVGAAIGGYSNPICSSFGNARCWKDGDYTANTCQYTCPQTCVGSDGTQCCGDPPTIREQSCVIC